MQKKREEQRATLEIRRLIQQLKVASLENTQAKLNDLEAAMANELPKTGSQMDKIKVECIQGADQAKARVEEARQQEVRFNEAKEKSAKLLAELGDMVVVAEKA